MPFGPRGLADRVCYGKHFGDWRLVAFVIFTCAQWLVSDQSSFFTLALGRLDHTVKVRTCGFRPAGRREERDTVFEVAFYLR
jgi:hypothetical protein